MARPFKYRDAVLTLLADNPVHPSVDWIHTRLRRQHPHVSLATVYRTLKALVAEGALCELPFGAGESRFGLNLEQAHYHFICEECRRILDLPTRVRSGLDRSVEAETGHKVARHTMEFYGVCRDCARAKKPRGSRPVERKERSR